MSRGRYRPCPVAAALLGLALLAAAGCGPRNGGRVPVAGTVTLDGQPVDGGVIVFLPDGDGKLPKAGGHIEQGKYAIPARTGPAPGKYRVEIRWEKKTGKQVTRGDLAEPYDETRQVIPARYNAQSELTADVPPGSASLDFALTSK